MIAAAASTPTADNTAVWVAAAVALLVAILAAVMADRRLARQLAHERVLTDRADLRDALAHMIATSENFYQAAYGIWHERDADDERQAAAMTRSWAAVETYNSAETAVRIRVGEDSPITAVIKRIDDAHDRLVKAAQMGGQKRFESAVKERFGLMAELVNVTPELRSRVTN